MDDNVVIGKSNSNILIIGLVIAIGAAAFFAGSYMTTYNSDLVTKNDLNDALAKLELKIMQKQLPTEQQSPKIIVSIDDDPIRGKIDAPITIIEFSDFQCPFCARFHTQTLPVLLENYIDTGKVRLVYRDFPIQGIHPNALPAAMAADCSHEQGKYWEYHDKLFENQNQWNRLDTTSLIAIFNQYALAIDLDQEQFDDCITSGKYLNEIQHDLSDGREYGVSGTPGFFIGNDKIGFIELKGAQPFENFKKIIDSQLRT